MVTACEIPTDHSADLPEAQNQVGIPPFAPPGFGRVNSESHFITSSCLSSPHLALRVQDQDNSPGGSPPTRESLPHSERGRKEGVGDGAKQRLKQGEGRGLKGRGRSPRVEKHTMRACPQLLIQDPSLLCDELCMSFTLKCFFQFL